MSQEILVRLACWLSAGVWLLVGVYKLAHRDRMIGVIRAHGLPFPQVSFWLSVLAEIGGSAVLLLTPYLWVACAIWLAFLVVATPVFHGRVIRDGAIDYPQYVQIGKNLSIAGGLVALALLDKNFIQMITR